MDPRKQRHSDEIENRELTLPISVKAVVGQQRKVALLWNERGEWELPGGKLEVGETPMSCLVREVEEELSWRVEPVTILDSWIYEITPTRSVFVVTYGCRLLSDIEPIVSHEHKKLGLVDIDLVPEVPMPAGYKASVASWFGRSEELRR